MRPLLLLLALVASLGTLSAQQSMSVENVRVEAPYTYLSSSNKGLRIKIDVVFSQYVEAYLGRSYKLNVVLVDAGGFAVFDSRNSFDFPIGINADKPSAPDPKIGMVVRDVSMFIPYKSINLPTGKQTVTALFSLRNDYGNYPDFARKSITFQHTKIDIKTLEQQKFTVKGPEMEYGVKGFGEVKPGMNVKFALGMAYGGDQLECESYLIHLRVHSADGSTLLYDSANEKDNPHREETLDASDFPGDPRNKTFFISYQRLRLNAPGDVRVTLEAEEKGKGTRQLYQAVHRFNTPPKYRYDQQVFTPSQVNTVQTVRDGVSGLALNFVVDYKFTGPLIDFERGDFYFFPILLGAKGDTVFSPTMLKRTDYGTTTGWSGQDPELDSTGSIVSLFVPSHRLRLKPGATQLTYTILVTDRARRARFPVVAKGTVAYEQPKIVTYDLRVDNLTVVPGEYDVEVAIFSSPLPDLEWRFEIGEDTDYQSPTAENSLTGKTGSHRLKLAEGDELFLGLWDIDSGFFNRSDALGRWKIPYVGKGDSFVHTVDAQGVIKAMSIQVTRAN